MWPAKQDYLWDNRVLRGKPKMKYSRVEAILQYPPPSWKDEPAERKRQWEHVYHAMLKKGLSKERAAKAASSAASENYSWRETAQLAKAAWHEGLVPGSKILGARIKKVWGKKHLPLRTRIRGIWAAPARIQSSAGRALKKAGGYHQAMQEAIKEKSLLGEAITAPLFVEAERKAKAKVGGAVIGRAAQAAIIGAPIIAAGSMLGRKVPPAFGKGGWVTRKKKVTPLDELRDGRGSGKGMPGGLRRNRNTKACTIGGPGYGKGAGRGLGTGRKYTLLGDPTPITTYQEI